MIERVVTNLLDNAMRHTPSGGEIRLAVWQENEQLQVEVADSGSGVDARCATICFSGLRR
jgi:K+-sensing histidine kinase KdpD